MGLRGIWGVPGEGGGERGLQTRVCELLSLGVLVIGLAFFGRIETDGLGILDLSIWTSGREGCFKLA